LLCGAAQAAAEAEHAIASSSAIRLFMRAVTGANCEEKMKL